MAYKKHEGSDCHKRSIEAIVTLPLQCKDIGEQLSNQVASEKRDNQQCLLKVLSNLRYLARQGIAIRGDGDESNSNFMRLLRLRQNEDPRIKDWIDKKTNKYVSHEIQNEVLKVMAFSHLRKIADDIASSAYFSIMCDECTDSSNREQLSINYVLDGLTLNWNHKKILLVYTKWLAFVQVIMQALLRIFCYA